MRSPSQTTWLPEIKGSGTSLTSTSTSLVHIKQDEPRSALLTLARYLVETIKSPGGR